jgi:spore coat protein U domain-containing protein, fimbrial subunit CupE1/2/3/6
MCRNVVGSGLGHGGSVSGRRECDVMKRISIAAAILAGSAAVTGSAFADPYAPANPATSDFHVGLQVVDECTIATVPIDFGSTGIISTMSADGAVTIQCTHGTPYQIGLDGGLNGTTAGRKMSAGGTDTINYQLYTDGSFADPWGEEQGVDTVDSLAATGADEVIPIHAHMSGHQNVAAGTYDDTIRATIWYAGEVVTP